MSSRTVILLPAPWYRHEDCLPCPQSSVMAGTKCMVNSPGLTSWSWSLQNWWKKNVQALKARTALQLVIQQQASGSGTRPIPALRKKKVRKAVGLKDQTSREGLQQSHEKNWGKKSPANGVRTKTFGYDFWKKEPEVFVNKRKNRHFQLLQNCKQKYFCVLLDYLLLFSLAVTCLCGPVLFDNMIH